MGLEGLSKLGVWQKAKEFAKRIYHEVLPQLPTEEKWAIAQQLRRASVSISANLAEGHGRFYYQDNVRFCYIARGSLEETLSHLAFCHEMAFISKESFASLANDGEEISRMLNGYIAYIKKSKQGANEVGNSTAIHEETSFYIADSENLS